MHNLRLDIQGLRNIDRLHLEPSQSVNVLVGANGSGKTSILEALYLLCRGQSFRDPKNRAIVMERMERAVLYGLFRQESGDEFGVGLQRDREGTLMKLRSVTLRSRRDLVQELPVQFLATQGIGLLEEGPAGRRRCMDWGVFHVEPGFHDAWVRFARALRQRNESLRVSDGQTASVWEPTLAESAVTVTAMRAAYFERLRPVLEGYIDRLLGVGEWMIRFRSGIPTGREYPQLLEEERVRDIALGYTHAGPQRADLVFRFDGAPAVERLSRGQQRRLIFSLYLAQAQVLWEETGRRPLLLVDDFGAELDAPGRAEILSVLREQGGQLFLTCAEPNELPGGSQGTDAWFHVEQGSVHPML